MPPVARSCHPRRAPHFSGVVPRRHSRSVIKIIEATRRAVDTGGRKFGGGCFERDPGRSRGSVVGEGRIRVGVIGAGTFAAEAHIPGIQAHPHGEVVALCARDRGRAMNMAARFGVPDVYTDYRKLVARPDIDAVTVATPDALHGPIAVAALGAGKHVFCEKPLAMTVAEARRMADAADRSGHVSMVGFTFRYTRALQALRRLLREGALGIPFYVSMHVHWGDIGYPGTHMTWLERADQATGGTWADGAAHLFDALAYILAPAQEVCAQMMVVPREEGLPQPDNVDIATCLARLRLSGYGTSSGTSAAFADCAPGTVHVTLLTSRVDSPYGTSDEIQVVGTRGAVSVALTRGAHERISLHGLDSVWTNLPLPDDASTSEPAALTRMMGAFVDAVDRGHLNSGQDPSFTDGLRTQHAIEAAVRSAREERWVDV